MNFRSKKILISLLLLFSFTLLADGYACEDFSTKHTCADCCMQCCPSHHLVPPLKSPSFMRESLSKQVTTISQKQVYPLLLVASIFHPPKAYLF